MGASCFTSSAASRSSSISGNRSCLLGAGGRLPAGEGVGEVDAGALVGRRSESGAPSSCSSMPNLQVRHHERRGQDLEAEDAVHGSLLDLVGARARRRPCACSVSAMLSQHLHQVGAGAAAGIEHDHARVGQAVGDAQLLAQHGVHAGHHVLHDLRRRVPDARAPCAARGRTPPGTARRSTARRDPARICAKKLARSTRFSASPAQSSTSPDAERRRAGRAWRTAEELLQHRARAGSQAASRHWKRACRSRVRVMLGPEHPGGEQAVEEGLHEGRAEEVLALLAGELQAERLFEGGARGPGRGGRALSARARASRA